MIMTRRLQLNSEKGNSLVSVLIAMAILSIAAVAISAGYSNLYAARRSAAASAAERDIQDAIVQSVVDGYRNYVHAQCAATSLNGVSSISVSSLATLSATQRITLPSGSGGNSDGDVQRCARTPLTDQPSPPFASTFYRCFQIYLPQSVAGSNTSSTSKIDKASFMASKGSFVEVLVHPRDFRTDSMVNCQASAIQASGYGLEIYYSLHWVLNSNQGLLYKTRVGSINAAL